MTSLHPVPPTMTRRELLQAGGLGFGTLALAALLQEGDLLAAGPDSTPATRGENLLPRPALGSWVSYGLGTVNQNLPAYIVLRDPEGYNTSGTLLWQNGWMPALYRGTEVNTRGALVLNLHPAQPRSAAEQRENLGLLARLN